MALVLLAIPAKAEDKPGGSGKTSDKTSAVEINVARDLCRNTSSSLDMRFEGCDTIIRENTEQGHDLAMALCNRGHVFTERREFDKALNDLDRAIALSPDYACARSNRGRVFSLQKQYGKAIENYNEAIRIEPDFMLGYNNRGDAYKNLGQHDRALADFNKAIELKSGLFARMGQSRRVTLLHVQFTKPSPTIQHILEIAPGVYNVLLRRGNVWRDMEQLKAEADYARVIKLIPNDARGWRNRGLIRKMTKGDAKKAVADYNEAIEVYLNDAGFVATIADLANANWATTKARWTISALR